MKCIKCEKEIVDGSVFCSFCGRKQVRESNKGKKLRGNGTGSVYRLPNGKYQIELTLGYIDGKRVRKTKSGFKTKKEALEYLPKLLNPYSDVKDIKFSEVFEQWKASHYLNIGKSKQSSYNTAYTRLKPLYLMRMTDIRFNDMQKLVDACPGAFYPKQDMKVLLNKVFQFAIINEYCKVNYAEHIKLPPLEKSNKDAFTEDEIKRLWDIYNSGDEFTGYILVMIYTGMRYGEISTILKENVHIEDRYMIGGIKTDAGKNRQILIAEKIVPIIEKLYAKSKKLLVEMSEEDFYSSFKDSIKLAGVRPLTPHCCRHTFATLMAKNNVHSSIIKEAAGHANYSTTLGYTHIPLETKLEAVNKL
jgi:integrase